MARALPSALSLQLLGMEMWRLSPQGRWLGMELTGSSLRAANQLAGADAASAREWDGGGLLRRSAHSGYAAEWQCARMKLVNRTSGIYTIM